jgi:ribosome biogenesis GTPase A
MAKGKRKLEELAGKLDVIIEVRDSRAPQLTSSPMIGQLSRIKPVWYVLSKSDLADMEGTNLWISHFRKKGQKAWAFDLLKGRIEPIKKALLEKKPAHREIRLAVVGIPNVGKSIFLNLLVGKKTAPVGGIPGVTRGVSWFKGQGFLVVDSPGILDPRSGDMVHKSLAWLGSSKADVIGGYDLLGMELLSFLRSRGLWHMVEDKWGIALEDEDSMASLERVGRRLGCLVSGGEVNLEMAGRRLIDAFSTGKLGRVTLESPEAPLFSGDHE